MHTARIRMFFLLSSAFIAIAPQLAHSETAQSFAEKIPVSLLQLGVGSTYYSPYAFVVDKHERTLTVWTEENGGYRIVEKFPADMGKNEGDKRSSGDARTPEGVYFLQEQLVGSSLDFNQYGNRAFTTDYPNYFDRRDGKTGHGIWLHAVPDKTPLTRGSRGCVVVRNEVIDKLQQYIRLKRTPLLIEPATEFVDATALRSETEQLTQTLESWRNAWETKNIDTYISAYSEEFRSQNMNREQWRKYKQNLNEKYQKISVQLSRPVVLRFKDRVVVKFIQAYSSDQHADVGEKTVYLKKSEAGFKIVGEEWAEDASQLASDEHKSGSLSTSHSTAAK